MGSLPLEQRGAGGGGGGHPGADDDGQEGVLGGGGGEDVVGDALGDSEGEGEAGDGGGQRPAGGEQRAARSGDEQADEDQVRSGGGVAGGDLFRSRARSPGLFPWPPRIGVRVVSVRGDGAEISGAQVIDAADQFELVRVRLIRAHAAIRTHAAIDGWLSDGPA
jgi:hypothetical protein